MAVTLKQFQFSWKALNTALNQIVDAINRNAPLEGDHIHLDEKGQHGVSINAVQSKPPGGDGQSNGSGNVTGTLQAVTLFDASGNPITLNVWTDGNNPGASSLSWQPITVVNPGDCSQSTVKVLTEP